MPRTRPLLPPDLGSLIIGAAMAQSRNDSDLAAILGISRQSFNSKKKHLLDKLSFNDIIKLCRELGITREQLINLVYLKN